MHYSKIFTLIGCVFLIQLLSLTPMLTSIVSYPNNSISVNSVETLSSTYVNGGDGYDEGVIDWINLKELVEYNNYFSSGTKAVLVVIDSGFGTEPWNKIEEDVGVEAAKTITYWRVHQYGQGQGELYYCHFVYENKSIIDDYTLHNENVTDETGHGTSIAYLIKRLVPNIRLLIIGVRRSHDGINIYDAMKALDLLMDGTIYYYDHRYASTIRLGDESFVLSLSWRVESDNPGLKSRLRDLAENHGVKIFASAGNDASTQPTYPASYTFVNAVAAIYDDGDVPQGDVAGNMTYFTSYGSWVDLCAPGYEVETIWWDRTMDAVEYVKVSGTSYSAPIVAASYVLLLDAADRIKSETGVSFSDKDILKAMYIALENKGDKTVPKPTINSPMVTNYLKRFDEYNGYGTIDIFDAVNFLGFLAMKRLCSGSYYESENIPFTIPLKVNVTLSHVSSVSNNLRGRYSVKYTVYKWSGHWATYSSGTLSRTMEGSGWDIWTKNLYFPGSAGGTMYRIKIYIYTGLNIVLIGDTTINAVVISPW